MIFMRHILMFFVILWISILTLFSQSGNFTIRTGAGYYLDTYSMDDGPIIWLEGGYKFKTGFNLNGRLSMTYMDWIIRDGTFKDYKTISLRDMIDLTFSRSINIGGNNYLEPGVGFKLKKEFLLKPDVAIITQSGNNILSTSYSNRFYEIGFTFYLDYYYHFKNNLLLGLRIDSNVIWAVGFEGLSISPLFGFRF